MANCPQCGTRILPGALACINCQRPVEPELAAAAGAPGDPSTPPPYALPQPPPYGAPPPPYGAPPPPYGAPPPPAPPYGGPPPAYVGPVPYSPGYYPQGPTPWSTNGMAIASLILSILWIGGLGSLLGVIFGHVSRGQIKKRPQRGAGLALAGLIIGYLGFAGSVAFYASLPHIIHGGFVQDILVQQDMRDAADAENSYHHDYGSYTTDSADLRNEDWTPLGRNTIVVATNDGLGYCIVGAHDGSDQWYVDDSANGGFSDDSYPTESEAEGACSVPGIGSFSVIN